MPICDDPNACGWYSLRADQCRPVAERPAFKIRFFTRSKAREIRRAVDAAHEAKDDGECFAQLMAAINLAVVGWKNFRDSSGNDICFNADSLADRLSDREIWELARNLLNPLTDDDLKNFALPAISAPASSVADAETGASTSQA